MKHSKSSDRYIFHLVYIVHVLDRDAFVENGSVDWTDTSYVIQIHIPQTEIKDLFLIICLTGIAHVFTDEMVQTRGGTNIVLHNCNVLVTGSLQWDSPPWLMLQLDQMQILPCIHAQLWHIPSEPVDHYCLVLIYGRPQGAQLFSYADI